MLYLKDFHLVYSDSEFKSPNSPSARLFIAATLQKAAVITKIKCACGFCCLAFCRRETLLHYVGVKSTGLNDTFLIVKDIDQTIHSSLLWLCRLLLCKNCISHWWCMGVLLRFAHWLMEPQSNRVQGWWLLGHQSSAVFYICFSSSLQLVLNFDRPDRNQCRVALSYPNSVFNHRTPEYNWQWDVEVVYYRDWRGGKSSNIYSNLVTAVAMGSSE